MYFSSCDLRCHSVQSNAHNTNVISKQQKSKGVIFFVASITMRECAVYSWDVGLLYAYSLKVVNNTGDHLRLTRMSFSM